MSSYSRTAILLTGVNGLVLGPAIALTGSSTIIASSAGIDLSINHSSSLGPCSGCGATVFTIVIQHDLQFFLGSPGSFIPGGPVVGVFRMLFCERLNDLFCQLSSESGLFSKPSS